MDKIPQIEALTKFLIAQNELMKLKLKFINLHFSIFWVLKEFWQNQIFCYLKIQIFVTVENGF